MMAEVEKATNLRRKRAQGGCSMLSESYSNDESIAHHMIMAAVILLLLLIFVSLWVIVHGSSNITVPAALGWMYGKRRP